MQSETSTDPECISRPEMRVIPAKGHKKDNILGDHPANSTGYKFKSQQNLRLTVSQDQRKDCTSCSQRRRSTNAAGGSRPDGNFTRSKEQEKGDWRVRTVHSS